MLALCGVAMIGAAATDAFSQSSRQLIGFERNNPEILAFRKQFPGGESSIGGIKMPALALPMLVGQPFALSTKLNKRHA